MRQESSDRTGQALQTEAALRRAMLHASEHLSGLNYDSVAATTSLHTLRERLGVDLTRDGVRPAQVVDELVEACRGGHLGNAGGRFFAWVIGGSLPSALAADWLASAWDQNAALHACGPAAAVVEEVAGAWLKDLLQIPPSASFAFTSGCQLAHATCLAAARYRLLKTDGWDVHADGMSGSPPITIFTSEHNHGSLTRAARLLGFGSRQLVAIPTPADGRLELHKLEEALRRVSGPKIVVLQAGDINVGAFDDFRELVPVAKRSGAWVHIDGAFGLWVAADPTRRSLLMGADQADSWATDAHKWLNVPYDNGLAFVRDVDAHFNAMSHRASYIAAVDGARDQIDWNPEWSRRARGFAVYAALRELGRDGISDLIDRTSTYAERLVRGIGALPGAKLIAISPVNQGLVRFLDPDPGASEEDHDRRTDDIIFAINATGEAFFSGTTWQGRRAMRISVCNWQTSAEDVRRAIDAARSILSTASLL